MKKIKVFWNGKKLRDIYPHATRWEVFKWKMRRLLRKIIIVSLILLTALLIFNLGGMYSYRVVYQKEEVILDNLTAKINELKGALVNDLKTCESAGFSEDAGLITFDPHPTNKKVQQASIGSYQFKKSTVTHYYKTLYNQDITGKEAILIALDDNRASQLASDIIFKTDNGLSNWFNCSKKYNLVDKLKIIKQLEN